jgi:hypothetical protein
VRSGLLAAVCAVACAAPVLTHPAAQVPADQDRSSEPLPTPESSLGFSPGDDYKLANYDETIAYFRRLDAASDRLTLVQAGTTSSGAPCYFALISAPENLAGIERYREIAQRLAHPEGLTDAEARRLARAGKAIVHIDGGLHATEVAGPQHVIQLAYDLLSHATDERVAAILDRVILMLWPTINPDGENIVATWYRGNVGTDYETAPLPVLYQKYVGHDNNRDAYMLNMIESRMMARTWRRWEPQIIYVHHQSSPFPTRIWLPPFAEPIAPRVPALMSRTVNMIGMGIARSLEERGQVGATHMGAGFDAWYPGYVDYLPMLQNINAFWTETALYRYATPHEYTIADFPPSYRAFRPESLYSSPWTPGLWRLKDAVDYMRTASVSVLDFAAKYKDDLLYDRYQAGRDQIRRYERSAPYAYVIPQDQRDPVAAVELLRRLAYNGIAVSQLEHAASLDGREWPAGTWVIPMNQPFAELARQLLDVQVYPDLRDFPDGPPQQPYDAAGWTLPLQMGVSVSEAGTPLTAGFQGAMRPLTSPPAASTASSSADASPFDSVPGTGFDDNPVAAAIVPPPGQAAGTGPALVVDAAQNNAFRAVNGAWTAGGTVRIDPARPGRFVLSGLGEAARRALVETLRLRAERSDAAGTPLPRPRLGLYQPWNASIDAGWTEWLFENYGFRFVPVRPSEVRRGLADRIDVLVIADESPRTLLGGLSAGVVPPPYAGGMGVEGVAALDAFVRAGGTLVCLNGSSAFAIGQLKLPVADVAAGLPRTEFFASGSLLEILPDAAHPVMAGMPDSAAAFFDNGPVFAPLDGFDGTVLAKYAAAGRPLLSGYLLGDRVLQGRAAALDVRHGAGHVLLIGFRPQWRGQPFGTFRVLFNAALFHGPLAAGAHGTPGFWTASPSSTREGR